MKRWGLLLELGLMTGLEVQAQSTVTDPGVLTITDSLSTISGSKDIADIAGLPTGSLTYLSYSSTQTLSASRGISTTPRDAAESVSSGTSTTATLSILDGSTTTTNATRLTTQTSISASATNTQPCNNYPEFCSRKYSNITEVAAHNSPFARERNAASNQQLTVQYQLNDGIRMLQGQTHYENDTLWFCHTSCDLLNAGTVQDYLTTVYDWVLHHPYDVVTILLGNSDNVEARLYEGPIAASGLARFAYTPPKVPMALDDWPTLSEMILTQKRVVFFLDYNANQTAVPYLLDEFSQLWETPFSPTDADFPCTVERPPELSDTAARNRMYMANHNLNTAVTVAGLDLLVPNTAQLNETNSVDDGNSSLGAMAEECASDWGRPPNFLLVDFYNIPNGSVFEVAAEMNNVTYTRSCCGTEGLSGAPTLLQSPKSLIAFGVFVASCGTLLF